MPGACRCPAAEPGLPALVPPPPPAPNACPAAAPQVGEQHRHDLSSMRHEVLGLLYPAFSAALADGGRLLTAHPASTGARFRLLHLALRYCRAQAAAARGKPCPLPIVLLYEQAGAGGEAGWVAVGMIGQRHGRTLGMHCTWDSARSALRLQPSEMCWLPLPPCPQVLAAALRWFELPEAWHDAEHGMLRWVYSGQPNIGWLGRPWEEAKPTGFAHGNVPIRGSTASLLPDCRCACPPPTPVCRREALGAVRNFAAELEVAPVPQLPRDLPPPHPVWGSLPPPPSNAARQALLAMLLSAGGWALGVAEAA